MQTKYFNYADLTWQEVAKLDRKTPLIIPIGENYPRGRILENYKSSLNLGFLPAIPFGWKGSLIESDQEDFVSLLNDLEESIRSAGFSQVIAALPENLNIVGISRSIQIRGWKIDDEGPIKLSNNDKVIVLPIGHNEQHAYHLPLSTDSDCISAISEGISEKIPDQVFCFPVFPYGVSMHQKSFAGTTTIGGRVFEKFWVSLIDTLYKQGFRKFYLINGHGGNHSFLVNVIKYAGNLHPDIFCATSYLYLSGPKGMAALEERRESGIGGMGHACELETSLMLAIRPELVHMERVVDEVDFISTPSYYQDWIEGGALIANPPWEDDTLTGAYGAGSFATREKGKYWLQIAIEEKVDHIKEINEQYNRRMQKRLSRKIS